MLACELEHNDTRVLTEISRPELICERHGRLLL